jgi:hypothetical protein
MHREFVTAVHVVGLFVRKLGGHDIVFGLVFFVFEIMF